MAVGSSPQFKVNMNVNCAVPDGTALSFPSMIASASTPDLNASNNASLASVLVSNPAPVLGPVSASPATLWPPNHTMTDVTIDYSVTDNCGIPACSLSVVSSEADNGLGDGNSSGDFEVVDDHHVRLRAERSGKGPGRTYTVTVTCEDTGGGFSSAQTEVKVPHNK
jgi:hypothetical protein